MARMLGACVPRESRCYFKIRWRRAFECSPNFEVATLPHHSKLSSTIHIYLANRPSAHTPTARRHRPAPAAESERRPDAPSHTARPDGIGTCRAARGKASGASPGGRAIACACISGLDAQLSRRTPRPRPRPATRAAGGWAPAPAADRTNEVDWKWTAGGPELDHFDPLLDPPYFQFTSVHFCEVPREMHRAAPWGWRTFRLRSA